MTMELDVQGVPFLVDDDDYYWLSLCNWYLLRTRSGKCYAQTTVAKKHHLLHRLVARTPEGMLTDHIDGNTLDNRRANRRHATRSENACNSDKRPGTRSRYRGLYFSRRHNKWVARIRVDKRYVSLGYYANEVDAALAYDEAAGTLHGEFARRNLPESAPGR
jgi:hypothetical protein